MACRLLIYFTFITTSATSILDWTDECNRCTCEWSRGRKLANCTNQNLYEIPKDLYNGIKDIDFSNNDIIALNNYEFSRANLLDVENLKFQNCSLEQVRELAFADLHLLNEVDLSRNKIISLNSHVFRQNTRLRVINLSHNNISSLEDGLFNNMIQLRKIEIAYNQIEIISPNTFNNLPAVNQINLSYNKIKHITFDLKKFLPRLDSLGVEGNPWQCDCHLQTFRQSIIKNVLTANAVECDTPAGLKGRFWQEPITFSCAPEIISSDSPQIEMASSNTSLICGAKGEPIPDIKWVINGQDNEITNNKQKYITTKNITSEAVWSILTITDLSSLDAGSYRCVAKNTGGEEERNITLVVPFGYSGQSSFRQVGRAAQDDQHSETMAAGFLTYFWIIGVCMILILFFIVSIMLVYRFHKRTSKIKIENTSLERSKSTSLTNISLMSINPVIKPPRTMETYVVDQDTELGQNLMDEDFIDGGNRESIPYRKFYCVPASHLSLQYLPDLIQYPRSSQLPSALVIPHSPQNDYRYSEDDHFDIYRTLPTPTSYIPYRPRIHPHGYVTLPRQVRPSNRPSVMYINT